MGIRYPTGGVHPLRRVTSGPGSIRAAHAAPSCGLRLDRVAARLLHESIADRDRLPQATTDAHLDGLAVRAPQLDEVIHVRAVEHAPRLVLNDTFPGVI